MGNRTSPGGHGWVVAWGRPDHLPGSVLWRDGQIALYADPLGRDLGSGRPPRSPFGPGFSASGHLVVIGEISHPVEASRPAVERTSLDPLAGLAEAWERNGVEALNQLRGGFSLVILDRRRKQLWLARDSVGIKTLYCSRSGAVRWIAPRLQLLAPWRSNAIDLIALRDYLCCAFVPGERTLWHDIREIRPGTVHMLPEDRTEVFYQLKEAIPSVQNDLSWYGQRLRERLLQVMTEYVPKEEEIGVYLSGGLDSSCITAIASRLCKKPVHTFSVHFGHDQPNELEFAELVAKHCHTNHHVLEISFKDLWDHLPETMAELDDPIGDPLTVPNLLVGRLAKRSVNVIFNGEGGDPCFGGPKNQPMLIQRLYEPIGETSLVQAFLNSFQKCATDLPDLMKPEIWESTKDQLVIFSEGLASSEHYLNRLMMLNIKYKGADHILTKVNNLSQAAGLEAISPLFDQRIVDMSMQIPPEFKLAGTQEKAVLKEAVSCFLPPTILSRPKSGMMVPVQLGFRHYWQRKARHLLLNRKASIANFLNPGLIKNWLDYRGDTWNRYGVKLWLLCSLEHWLKANGS